MKKMLLPTLVLLLPASSAWAGAEAASTSVVQTAGRTSQSAAKSTPAIESAAGDDSYYCTPGETVTNLPQDGPAQPLQRCVYTALGSYRPATIKTICPSGQKQSSTMPRPGSNCDYNTYTAALQATGDGCGIWYMIKSTSDGTPSGTQNEYTEPGNASNIPDTRTCTSSTWNWVTTDQFSSLPPEGSRITPAWTGTGSLPGYPSYGQPAVAGVYVPRLDTSSINAMPLSWCGSAAYWRFMGLEITTVAGVGGSTWVVGTLPGTAGRCTSNFGGDHMIFDRMIVHGSANPTWHSDYHASWVKWGVRFNGTYDALINSYCGDFLMAESHCVAWGVGLTSQTQGPIKVVNNFLSAGDESLFTGGGPQSAAPEDAEIRRNYLFKPLFWYKQCYDPLPAFCNGIHFWGGANATMSRSGGEVTATITPYANSLPFASDDKIAIVQASDATFETGGKNSPRIYKLASVNGNTLHWTQAANSPDAKNVSGVILNNSVAPSIKNALEFKNQDRALIEGNVFEYSWQGQSDQVGELVALNAIGHPRDTNGAPVSNITMRYNILRHGNMGIQFGSEKIYRKAMGIGNLPVAVRAGKLGPMSVHDNLVDDINGAYWNLPGSGLNSIGMRLVNAYPAPLHPANLYLNHNTIIQSSNPDTRGTRGVAGSKLFGINDFSSANFNRGYVNTNGATVTLNCRFKGYGVGCDNFSTSGAWVTTPIWINDAAYTIQSVSDSTHLTLTSSAGTQSNVLYSAPCDSAQRGACKPLLPLPWFDLWPSFTFTNNIGVGGFASGTGVMPGAARAGSEGTLDSYMSKAGPTAYVVKGNIFVTAQMAGQPSGEPYPPNNGTLTDFTKIGFASFTDGNWNGTNDYHLCTGAGAPVAACKAASRLYVHSAWPTTDGLPPGADLDKVNAFTSKPPQPALPAKPGKN